MRTIDIANSRYVAYLPTAKVQSVVVRQSPIEQLLGIAELTVHVAGGSPTRLPDLTIENARALRDQLAALAALAAARDWLEQNPERAAAAEAAEAAATAADPAAPRSTAEDSAAGPPPLPEP